MEIRNILTFLKVAGTQNFSKSSRAAGVLPVRSDHSDTAVGKKSWETQLFERIGKRVYLTEKRAGVYWLCK